MSVLIKGMEMPKSCGDCRFHKSIYCTLTDICTNTAQGCPLVPVPTPHGDLIDRYDLKHKKITIDYNKHDDTFLDGFLFVADLIDNAPTIIEAEESK